MPLISQADKPAVRVQVQRIDAGKSAESTYEQCASAVARFQQKSAAASEVDGERTPRTRFVAVLGGPGSGKRTLCRRLCFGTGVGAHLGQGFGHVCPGDELRAHAASGAGNAALIAELIEAGGQVDDSLLMPILRAKVAASSSSATCSVVLLDGFPRTLAQADAISELGGELTQVRTMLVVLVLVVLVLLAVLVLLVLTLSIAGRVPGLPGGRDDRSLRRAAQGRR